MKFQNPLNQYVEESNAAWFWVLLFGPLYFAYKTAWWATLLAMVLAGMTLGISWLIMPFLAEDMVRKSYLRRGWVELNE